nr:TLD domain-containing protein 1 isoform X4 [Bubalus bubalis]
MSSRCGPELPCHGLHVSLSFSPPAPVLPAGASPSLCPFPRVFRPPGGQAAVPGQQWRSLFLVDQRRGLGRDRGAPILLCSRLRCPPHTRPRLDDPGFALRLCALRLLPGVLPAAGTDGEQQELPRTGVLLTVSPRRAGRGQQAVRCSVIGEAWLQCLAQILLSAGTEGGGKLLGPQWLDRDCDQAVLEDWVFRAHHVATFLSLVINQGFLLLRSSLKLATLVPERQVDPQREFASVLDVLSVIYVNSHLPQELRLRWRLLFATELHGNSFAQLCGRIAHGGPCLVLLEDLDGHVFGGFASCSWEVKPQFQGDDRCFLFSVSPRMAVYTCTGYNDHYMYLNQGQQTIPNGLGMGGQHGYFGLWIDVDFGKGHSKAKPTCTTYGSPQLSAQEDFQFQKMEVWAVGDAPKAESVKKTRSILDIDPEARALLEASGRGRHSEGLREVPDEP